MTITVSPQPKSQVKLTIELSPEEMRPHLEKAAEHISSEHKIEGFRPGKASLGIVIQKLGAQAVWQEAAEFALRQAYVAALRQEKVKSIGHPRVSIVKLAPDNPFVFTAEVATLPAVKLDEYKKIKAKKPEVKVSPEQEVKALEDLRAMFATEALVDRAAESGDKVEVDFDVAINHVPLEHGSSKQHPIVIGSNQFIPGFEEQLIGLKKDGTKEFTLKFPKDYHNKEVADKPGQFTVKVTSVFQVNKPELNEDFVKKVGKFSTLEELKSHLHSNLQSEADERADAKFEETLIDELIGKTKFGELPDVLVESEIGKMLSEMKEQVLRQGGIKFEDYLNSIKKTETELRQEFRQPGIRRVKAALIIRHVADAENITADDADVEKEVQTTLKMYEHDMSIKEKIDSQDYRDYIRAMLVNRKVIEYLKNLAATAN